MRSSGAALGSLLSERVGLIGTPCHVAPPPPLVALDQVKQALCYTLWDLVRGFYIVCALALRAGPRH